MKYQCNNCDFASDVLYWCRVKCTQHHQGRSAKPATKCNECDFTTRIASRLKRHVETTHGQGESDHPAISPCNLTRPQNGAAKKDLSGEPSDSPIGTSETMREQHKKNVLPNMKGYNCHTCGYSSNNLASLTRHRRTVHENTKDQKCDSCDYATNRGDSLKQHKKTVHDKMKDFRCQECDYTSSNSCHIGRHKKAVHDKIKDHKCDSCQFSTCDAAQLKRHRREVHDKIRNFCRQCGHSFSRASNLREHVDTVHKAKRSQFDCFSISSRLSLPRHLKSSDVHSQLKSKTDGQHATIGGAERDGQLKAIAPQRVSVKAGAIHAEVKGERSDDATETRVYLESQFKTVHSSRAKDKQCPHCAYSSSYASHLKSHIKAVHDKVKDNSCPHCDYSSGYANDMKRHIKAVHDNIKDKSCPHCDYLCGYANYLKRHIKAVHERVKGHQCSHCDFSTSRGYSLKMHVTVVHENIKFKKCPQCEYSSSYVSHLRSHIWTVHDNKKVNRGSTLDVLQKTIYKERQNGHLKEQEEEQLGKLSKREKKEQSEKQDSGQDAEQQGEEGEERQEEQHSEQGQEGEELKRELHEGQFERQDEDVGDGRQVKHDDEDEIWKAYLLWRGEQE